MRNFESVTYAVMSNAWRILDGSYSNKSTGAYFFSLPSPNDYLPAARLLVAGLKELCKPPESQLDSVSRKRNTLNYVVTSGGTDRRRRVRHVEHHCDAWPAGRPSSSTVACSGRAGGDCPPNVASAPGLSHHANGKTAYRGGASAPTGRLHLQVTLTANYQVILKPGWAALPRIRPACLLVWSAARGALQLQPGRQRAATTPRSPAQPRADQSVPGRRCHIGEPGGQGQGGQSQAGEASGAGGARAPESPAWPTPSHAWTWTRGLASVAATRHGCAWPLR